MSLESDFTAVVNDALRSEPRVQSVLQGFTPIQLDQWQLSMAVADTARTEASLLAYPVNETAGFYLVITSASAKGKIMTPGDYLLEVMADNVENGCELIVVHRADGEFEVLYVDPDLI